MAQWAKRRKSSLLPMKSLLGFNANMELAQPHRAEDNGERGRRSAAAALIKSEMNWEGEEAIKRSK